jgi:hypothetical protein
MGYAAHKRLFKMPKILVVQSKAKAQPEFCVQLTG